MLSPTVAYLSRTLCRMDCLLPSKTQEAISPADPLVKCVLFFASHVRMIVICDMAAQAHLECVKIEERKSIGRWRGRDAAIVLLTKATSASQDLRISRPLCQQHCSVGLGIPKGSLSYSKCSQFNKKIYIFSPNFNKQPSSHS